MQEEQDKGKVEQTVQETCPGCNDDYCNFLFVSKTIRKDADHACTTKMPDRILCNVRRRLVRDKMLDESTQPHPWFSFYWIFRYALLAVALIIFCWLMFIRDGKGKPAYPDSTPSGIAYAEMTRQNFSPRRASVYRTQAAFSSSFSPLESSFHGHVFCVLDGTKSYQLCSPPGMIPGNLTQIWVSPSFQSESLTRYLKVLCTDLNISDYKMMPCGSALAFSAKMKARQTAVMVKQLHAWGMQTISFHAPNPGQNFFIGNGFKPVQYQLFVLMPAKESVTLPASLGASVTSAYHL